MPENIYDLAWAVQLSVIIVGLGIIGYLLNKWFSRIEGQLDRIWKEFSRTRENESWFKSELSALRARCDERHAGCNGRHDEERRHFERRRGEE
jgi:hypothetical protein